MTRTKSPFASALWPLGLAVALAAVYGAIFFSGRSAMAEQFDYWTSRIPSIVLYGSGTAAMLKGKALAFGGLVGVALAVGYLIFAYMLLGIAALTRLTRWRGGAALAYLVAALPLVVAAFVVHGEPTPRTAISATVLAFADSPLWLSSLVTVSLAAVLFIVACFYAPRTER